MRLLGRKTEDRLFSGRIGKANHSNVKYEQNLKEKEKQKSQRSPSSPGNSWLPEQPPPLQVECTRATSMASAQPPFSLTLAGVPKVGGLELGEKEWPPLPPLLN